MIVTLNWKTANHKIEKNEFFTEEINIVLVIPKIFDYISVVFVINYNNLYYIVCMMAEWIQDIRNDRGGYYYENKSA